MTNKYNILFLFFLMTFNISCQLEMNEGDLASLRNSSFTSIEHSKELNKDYSFNNILKNTYGISYSYSSVACKVLDKKFKCDLVVCASKGKNNKLFCGLFFKKNRIEGDYFNNIDDFFELYSSKGYKEFFKDIGNKSEKEIENLIVILEKKIIPIDMNEYR